MEKKVISGSTQRIVLNGILGYLVDNHCTLSDFYDISRLVADYYSKNATIAQGSGVRFQDIKAPYPPKGDEN